MRKKMIFCLLLVTVSSFLFASGAHESSQTFGAGYHRISESLKVSGSKVVTTINGVGLWLDSQQFKKGSDVGFYVDSTIFFPLGMSIGVDGNALSYSLSGTGFRLGGATTIGVAYKKDFNPKLNLSLGVGPALQVLSMGSSGSSSMLILLGAGGNVGLNIKISDKLFFNVGIRGEIDFATYVVASGSGSWSTDGFTYTLTPHVGINIRRSK